MATSVSAPCSRLSDRHRSWSRVRLVTCAWACALAAGAAPSADAEIVYTMTNASSLQNGWTLSGTIMVTGTGSGLSSADITGWSYTVSEGSTSHSYSSADAGTYVNTYELLATATELIVPYPASPGRPYLQMNALFGAANLYWTTGGSEDTPYYSAAHVVTQLWSEYNPAYPSTTTEGWVIGTVTSAVPEIDPAGFGSVLALVAGALGVFERRRWHGSVVAVGVVQSNFCQAHRRHD